MNHVQPVSPNVTIADQPTEADLQALKQEGYAGVVNLRNDGEPEQPLSTSAEGERVRALGMDYLHVGVGGQPLTDADVSSFNQFMDRHESGKVLVHCRKGSRAAALVVLRKALSENWKPDDVAAKSQAIGLPIDGGLLTKVQDYLRASSAK